MDFEIRNGTGRRKCHHCGFIIDKADKYLYIKGAYGFYVNLCQECIKNLNTALENK